MLRDYFGRSFQNKLYFHQNLIVEIPLTTLSNLRNGWSAYIFDIGVAYKKNTEHVMENMQWEVGREFLRRVKYAFDKNTNLDSDQFNGL